MAKKGKHLQKWKICLVALLLLGCSQPEAVTKSETKFGQSPPPLQATIRQHAGDRLFQNEKVKHLSLRFSESDGHLLEQEDRPYVRADFSDGATSIYSVGIKLKGAAGSYQLLSGKPGFTVKFDKFRKKQTFDQLDKIHLNNSVQDGTYLCEWLGSEVFRLANYPSPRVSHALLKRNEQSEAMYVIREAYDKSFLRRYYSNTDGNLYDGGFLQDLDADLEKDSGLGVDDRSDLQAIVAALDNTDSDVRYREMEKRVDLERFVTFMALERMLCHWDGYSENANNYRVYIHPDTGLAIFFPHGMDQLMGDPNMSLFEFPTPRVSSQVMGSDKWRTLYRTRVKELLPVFDPPNNLIQRLDTIAAVVRKSLEELGNEPLQQFESQLEELKNRIVERVNAIKGQLALDEEKAIDLAVGESAKLKDWYPQCDREEMAILPESQSTAEPLQLSVNSEPGYASWRHRLCLKRGTYRIEGKYRTEGVQPIDDLSVESIGIGHSRQERWSRPENDDWQDFSSTILIVEDRFAVEVIVGLRAKHGVMQVDRSSFRISRID